MIRSPAGRTAGAACLLSWLATCAAPQQHASAPAVCELRKAAEIPVRLDRGFVEAPAVVDKNDVTLLIDTAAEDSQVTPAAMRQLDLHQDSQRQTTIHGLGGTVTTRNALLQSFGIGGMEQLGQSVAVAPLPPGKDLIQNASGLLGADWLSSFDVELDLPHRRVALYRVHGCEGDYVPWPGAKASVLVSLYGAGIVLLPVQVDGRPVTAALDSGANATTLTDAAAARIGADRAALARDPSSQTSGVDLARLDTRRHRFASLQVGSERYADPVIAVSALHITFADMLLGADWLRSNRVWISYAGRRVTIQPDRPAPAS